MMKGLWIYGCTLVAFFLIGCTRQKIVEIPLKYHSSFPKDVDVKMEKIPVSPKTESTWEMRVLGDRMLLATSEMDNSDYKLLVSAKSQKYRPYVSPILSDKHCGHIFKK